MGKLILISGASGAGKTTIGESYFGKSNEAVSFTTRAKRHAEVDGVDYQFRTREEVLEMRATGYLAEFSEYGGNLYGLTKQELDSKIANASKYAYAVVDCHGMEQLKKLYPEAQTIFVALSLEETKKRLETRNETPEFISQRTATYELEMNNASKYDFVLDNSKKLEETLENLDKYLNQQTYK